jgi:hypothetical protein
MPQIKTGQKTGYPLAVPLARDVSDSSDLRALHIFRGLLLLECIDPEPSLTKHQQEFVATQLELATWGSDSHEQLIREIPIPSYIDLDGHLVKIRDTLETITNQARKAEQNETKPYNDDQLRLIEAILILLHSRVRRSKKSPRHSTGTRYKRPAPPPSITVEPELPKEEDEDTPDVLIDRPLVHGYLEHEEEDSTIDPPESTWGIQLDTLSLFEPDEEEASEPLQEEMLRAAQARSARWIVNTLSRTPVSSARLNPLERLDFLTNLREGVSQTGTAGEATLCIALMYTTGRNLEHLLGLEVGPGGEIDPEGYYKRQWLRPESCVTPDPDLLYALGRMGDTLYLPLPSEVITLLRATVGQRQRRATLGDCLTTDKETLNQAILTTIGAWRDHGRYRLKRERVLAALPTELHILYRDPMTIFLLSGSQIHQSPTIHHYQAQSHSLLRARWTEVMDALFQH